MEINKCPHCGKEYTLGVNGIVSGCDECEGVTRDVAGFAWQDSYGQCVCFEYSGDNKACPVRGRK